MFWLCMSVVCVSVWCVCVCASMCHAHTQESEDTFVGQCSPSIFSVSLLLELRLLGLEGKSVCLKSTIF